jgi:hypothetical protein
VSMPSAASVRRVASTPRLRALRHGLQSLRIHLRRNGMRKRGGSLGIGPCSIRRPEQPICGPTGSCLESASERGCSSMVEL